MRNRAAGALICALAVLAAAAPAQARPQAVIVLLPANGKSDRTLLEEFAKRGMAIGMTSPTVGGFKPRQMALDLSQGARIPTRLYSPRKIGPLVESSGRLEGWDAVLRRADKAPGDVEPGLLASTIMASGGRVGFRGRGALAPIVAADRGGVVHPARPGDALDVVQARGLGDLDRALAQRGPNGVVYVVRAPVGKKLRLLPAGLAAPGVRGQLRSATTRRNGLVTATDVAPTVLHGLGIAVPDAMQGETIEGRGSADAAAVAAMNDRLGLVTERRGAALLWLFGSWLVAALVFRRRGLRAGLLAGLWFPGMALVAGAIEPGSAVAEGALIGVGSVALGLLTDVLVPWPCAPAVPAAAVFLAHTIDLAAGSTLIGRSIAGPNPAGGARFFGIGNELETLLSVSVLIGTGAAIVWSRRERSAPVVFAFAAVVAGLVMGAGRLGADVGAVITLGAGGAAAVVASLPGGPSRRAVALGIAAPVAGLIVLIVIDLVVGGGAHLTKSVLHANSSEDLADVVRRRFGGSFSGLKKPAHLIEFALAVGILVWLAVRRRAILAGAPRAFGAGLIGAWFAVVVGAISNDSGPLIAEIGAIFLLLAFVYVRGRPEDHVHPPG